MNEIVSRSALIGVDWGLTHLRAYCIGEEGDVLDSRANDRGILVISGKSYAAILQTLIGDWYEQALQLPIIVCGMIGSRNGWVEAPYNDCPASLRDVARSAMALDIGGGRAARLIGGLYFTDEQGRIDVIRGEETQLFGVARAADLQLVVTPGTHSKWAIVNRGQVERFRTYVTGELYSVLRGHSSLGWWTREVGAAQDREESFWDSFKAGVRASLEDSDLAHSLFSVRTRALFVPCTPAAHAAYLSGIVIGNEVESGLRRHSERDLLIVGASELTSLYQTALSIAGVKRIEVIAGEQAIAQGLWRIWKERVAL